MAKPIDIRFGKSPRGMNKKFKEYQKETLQRMGKKWLNDYFPLRFEENSQQKYGFTPRTKKYMADKRAKYGHQKHLVFSGEMERWFKTNKPTEQKNTNKEYQLKWRGAPKQVVLANRVQTLDDIEKFIIEYPENNMYIIQQEVKKQFDREMRMDLISRIRKGLGRQGKRKMPPIKRELTTITRSENKELLKDAKKHYLSKLNKTDDKIK